MNPSEVVAIIPKRSGRPATTERTIPTSSERTVTGSNERVATASSERTIAAANERLTVPVIENTPLTGSPLSALTLSR